MDSNVKSKMRYNNLEIDVKAVFVKDRKYRYFLSYIWDKKKPCLGIIMFNPSVADENSPDKTHAKLINKFSNKYGGIKVINLISYKSQDPKQLKNNIKKVDIDVCKCLKYIDTDDVLFAWGCLATLLPKEKRNDINISISKIIAAFKGKNLYQLIPGKIVHPLIRKKTDLYKFNEKNLIKF